MKITLEKQTQQFIDQLAAQNAPPIYKLTPNEARAVLEKVQSSRAENPAIRVEELTIPGGPKGDISIHIIRPEKGKKLPVIMYFHGAGWVMGSLHTHENLVRKLAVETRSAVVFVNYHRSPEERYPVAIEEAYAATEYIAKHGREHDLDTKRLSIAGDSVGGNMAIAVTLLAKELGGPKIDRQVLFYPVTSAAMNTPSYEQFADGPWLTKPAMEYFWKAYQPDSTAREKIFLSPLNATPEQVKGLPPALVITAENDVLRDEGEAYAALLMSAGVNVTAVRTLGTIHDFVMLNALASTPAALSAIALASEFLRSRT